MQVCSMLVDARNAWNPWQDRPGFCTAAWTSFEGTDLARDFFARLGFKGCHMSWHGVGTGVVWPLKGSLQPRMPPRQPSCSCGAQRPCSADQATLCHRDHGLRRRFEPKQLPGSEGTGRASVLSPKPDLAALVLPQDSGLAESSLLGSCVDCCGQRRCHFRSGFSRTWLSPSR